MNVVTLSEKAVDSIEAALTTITSGMSEAKEVMRESTQTFNRLNTFEEWLETNTLLTESLQAMPVKDALRQVLERYRTARYGQSG